MYWGKVSPNTKDQPGNLTGFAEPFANLKRNFPSLVPEYSSVTRPDSRACGLHVTSALAITTTKPTTSSPDRLLMSRTLMDQAIAGIPQETLGHRHGLGPPLA